MSGQAKFHFCTITLFEVTIGWFHVQGLEAAIYLMKYKPNLNTRPVSGLGSDVYEYLIDAVPVGTASLTRQLLKQPERMYY